MLILKDRPITNFSTGYCSYCCSDTGKGLSFSVNGLSLLFVKICCVPFKAEISHPLLL